MSAARGMVSRILGLAVVPALGLLSLVVAPAASAHTVLLSTTPRAGATVPQPPIEVTLTFEEPPLVVGSIVRVTGPQGDVVSVGPLRIVAATVHQKLASGLVPGSYRVDWKVTSDDGHPVSDTFRFAVGGAAGASSSASSSPASTSPASGSPTSTSPTSASPTSASPSSTTSMSPDSTSGTWWPALLLTALVLLAAAVVVIPRIRRLVTSSRSRREP